MSVPRSPCCSLVQQKNTAAVGYDADKNGSFPTTNLYADSLTVTSTKNRVRMIAPTFSTPSTSSRTTPRTSTSTPSIRPTYLGSNNYYTEAIAGQLQAMQRLPAPSRSMCTATRRRPILGTTSMPRPPAKQSGGEQLGVEVAAHADTQAIAFSGSVAGAKKVGVRISNSDIVNLDETRAEIGAGSNVRSQAADAGVKVTVDSKLGHRQRIGERRRKYGNCRCWRRTRRYGVAEQD